MKFLGVIKAWVVAHKVAAIAIAAGATAVIATSVIVPVAVSNAKVEITWKNEDGSVLRTDKVKKGDIPSYGEENPTKAATAQYSYTFAGWEPEVVKAKENAEYKATFSSSINSYSVKFVDDDGTTELKSESLQYGATPVAPADPEKADTAEWDYTFNGWNKEIATVEGDQTYTATYSKQKQQYLVRFLDDDGTTELKADYVNYGDMPVAPADPDKTDTAEWDYSFNGWDKEISEVHSAQTYIATYSATKQKYTITWKDDNGSVLKTEKVNYGTIPSYGTAPEKAEDEGHTYAFNGWSPTPAEVTGEAEYTATYTPTLKKFDVVFKDYDGTVLGTKQMSYDDLMSGALCPVETPPSRADEGNTHFQFLGWDRAYTNVYPDTLVYTASYLQYYLSTDKYYVESLTTSFFEGEVIIPDTFREKPVTQILHDAFKNRRIGGISIGKNVNYIGENAFECCEIESISIPGTVGTIDANAFKNTTKLQEVTFHEGTTQIRAHAFDGSGFRYLILPASVSTVSTMAFANNHSLIKATLNATDFSGYDSPYYGTNIFGNCGSFTELICPNAAVAYDNGYGDQTLTRLNSSTKDNTGTFDFIDPDEETNELGKITYVKKGDTKVYLVSAFDNVGLTRKILHTDGFDQIKKCAFEMTDVEEVYISKDITAIGKEAFEYCDSLEILEFEEGDTNLSTNSSMFRGCTKLESVDMSARRMDDLVTYGFEGCTKLSNLVMSPYATHIGGFALTNTAVEEFFIPKDVNGIDSDAFRTTSSLKKFVVDSESTYYKAEDDCLYTKNGKRMMAFPSAKVVEDNTFTVPEGVEELMGRVFQEATLEVINLPSTLKALWNFSFYRSNATTVNYPGTKAQFEALTVENGWARDASFTCVHCLGDSSTSTLGF